MSNATELTRSSRSDARGFADAFSAADDAFTFDRRAGESRTMSLAELEAVLELDGPVDVGAAVRATPAPLPAPQTDPDLLTLAELGDVLAGSPATPEVLDFDFGSTAERARRRTAARSDALPADLEADGRGGRESAGAVPRGTRVTTPAPHRPLSVPEQAWPSSRPAPAGLDVSRRPLPGSVALRRVRADPDRIALYAVLLGILLVLIAASSSSASAVTALSLQLL